MTDKPKKEEESIDPNAKKEIKFVAMIAQDFKNSLSRAVVRGKRMRLDETRANTLILNSIMGLSEMGENLLNARDRALEIKAKREEERAAIIKRVEAKRKARDKKNKNRKKGIRIKR